MLWWRIGTLLVLVIALVLILISFLNYSNYRKTYLELNLTRYLVLAKNLRQTVEGGLNIGLKPEENVNLSPAIKELSQRHSGIRYIGVIHESGALIGEGQLPEHAASNWKAWYGKTKTTSYWHASDAGTFQIGIPFVNNFNVETGAVVIAYDRTAIERATSDMARKLALDTLLTLFLLAALTLGGVYALTRKFSRQLSGIGSTIDSTLSAATPVKMDDDMLDDGVAKDINDFTALGHGVVRELAELERGMDLPEHGSGA